MVGGAIHAATWQLFASCTFARLGDRRARISPLVDKCLGDFPLIKRQRGERVLGVIRLRSAFVDLARIGGGILEGIQVEVGASTE